MSTRRQREFLAKLEEEKAVKTNTTKAKKKTAKTKKKGTTKGAK